MPSYSVNSNKDYSVNAKKELIIPYGETKLFVPDNLIGKFKSVIIPKSVEIIEKYCFNKSNTFFHYNTELQSVTFEPGSQLTEIRDGAFYCCNGLKRIEIPKSVKKFGIGSFFGCKNLESVTFEEGSQLEILGESCFNLCPKLKSIKIPKSVEKIPRYCFKHCVELKSVTFEEGSCITDLGNEAFYQCENLPTITIPKSVTYIDDGCFVRCEKLKSITFEKGINVRFGKQVFRRCLRLKKIICDKKCFESLKDNLKDYDNYLMTQVAENKLKILSHDERDIYKNNVATKLQARVRGHQTRKKYKKKKENTGLNEAMQLLRYKLQLEVNRQEEKH